MLTLQLLWISRHHKIQPDARRAWFGRSPMQDRSILLGWELILLRQRVHPAWGHDIGDRPAAGRVAPNICKSNAKSLKCNNYEPCAGCFRTPYPIAMHRNFHVGALFIQVLAPHHPTNQFLAMLLAILFPHLV